MAQEIKDLIAKIQQEGVQAAEKQAAGIKVLAETSAKKIIAEAKIEAQKIIEQANINAKKTEDSTNDTLKQAGRDLLISLRKEINSMLNGLIKQELRQALGAQDLAKIIEVLVKNAPLALGSEIIVSLNEQDKTKLEQGFLKQLAQAVGKQIILKSADGIGSGFVISFDAGKSIFDFSDQALTEYISGCFRPELSKILKV